MTYISQIGKVFFEKEVKILNITVGVKKSVAKCWYKGASWKTRFLKRTVYRANLKYKMLGRQKKSVQKKASTRQLWAQF